MDVSFVLLQGVENVKQVFFGAFKMILVSWLWIWVVLEHLSLTWAALIVYKGIQSHMHRLWHLWAEPKNVRAARIKVSDLCLPNFRVFSLPHTLEDFKKSKGSMYVVCVHLVCVWGGGKISYQKTCPTMKNTYFSVLKRKYLLYLTP